MGISFPCFSDGLTTSVGLYKFLQFLKNFRVELLYDPAILLLGVYLKELKTKTQTDACEWMLMAALFPIARRGKQPKCPLTDEQYYMYLDYLFFLGLQMWHMARGWIRTVAAGLHHSHSNTGSKPHPQPTPQLMATGSWIIYFYVCVRVYAHISYIFQPLKKSSRNSHCGSVVNESD